MQDVTPKSPRYYNPVLGRFISADSIVSNYSNPQTLNRYSYVENNPVNYTDPTGHRSWRKKIRKLMKLTSQWLVNPNWAWKSINDEMLLKYPALAQVEGVAASYFGQALGAAAFSAYTTRLYGGHFNDMLKSAGISLLSDIAGYAGSTISRNAIVKSTIGGMARGATNAALTGGNVTQSMLVGGISGGISASVRTSSDFVRIATGTMTGGTLTAMTGGSFSQGAMTGGLSAIGAITAEDLVNYEKNIGKSEEMAKAIIKTSLSPVEQWNALVDLYNSETFGGRTEGIRNFDLLSAGDNMLKFGSVHVRWDDSNEFTSYPLAGTHFDGYDVVTSPIMHTVQSIYMGVRFGWW
jgi:hypothetical protein